MSVGREFGSSGKNFSVSVSLKNREATVIYDSSITRAQFIYDCIDDMDFGSVLPPHRESVANGSVGGRSPSESRMQTFAIDSSVPAGRATFKRPNAVQVDFNVSCQHFQRYNG